MRMRRTCWPATACFDAAEAAAARESSEYDAVWTGLSAALLDAAARRDTARIAWVERVVKDMAIVVENETDGQVFKVRVKKPR